MDAIYVVDYARSPFTQADKGAVATSGVKRLVARYSFDFAEIDRAGGRLVGKASQLLKRDGGKHDLATQCIGGGQGIAMMLEAA
jgi:acetyl-CoA acetyltransferase